MAGEDSRWHNRVSARWLLGRPFRPARHAATLHWPWLARIGEADQFAAPDQSAARAAPHGELRTYPGIDHFDIYDGPQHETLIRDQLDFLHRHLQTPAPTDRRLVPQSLPARVRQVAEST